MTRVTFVFDDTMLRVLQKITKKGGFRSMGEALRESINISQIFQTEADGGFSEILLRNDRLGQEKELKIPSIKRRLRPVR